MLIGVMSDTHDRVPAIAAALELFSRHDVAALVHAGDIVAPFAAKVLQRFARPIHVIYGNNDGERAGLLSLLPQIRHGPVRLELGGRRILLHHFIDWCDAEDIRQAEIVITGHSHEVVNELRDGKLYLNPGECCGWVGGRCTVALLEVSGPSAEIVELSV
ncbi:MAG: metallophosphoesterase [Phycisphaerae bacterium]